MDEALAALDSRRLATGLAMLLVLTFSLLAGSPAFAQTCLGGSSAACNAGGASDICYLTTTVSLNDTIECDLAANFSGATTALTAVTDSNIDFHFWGTDGGLNPFCCILQPNVTSGQTYIDLYGTGVIDDIRLRWTTYDLDTYNMVPLDVTVYGLAGADTIFGSDTTGNVYLETIAGGAGNDTIDGGDGDDLVYGGPNDDTINLQGGDDECYGESGKDTIDGGTGNDEIVGGTTAGEGNTLSGGDGNDTLCDEPGLSALVKNSQDGGDGSDDLWIDGRADFTDLNGGPGVTDECVTITGAAGALRTQCESILTTKPTFCP